MALTDVAKARATVHRAGDRALSRVVGAGEQLLVHVPLARLPQSLERCRVAAALGEAMPAVAERMRVRGEPSTDERGILGEREGLAHVRAHVLAHGQLVDLVLGDAVEHAAG